MPDLDPSLEALARTIDYKFDLADVRATRRGSSLLRRIGHSTIAQIGEMGQHMGYSHFPPPVLPEAQPKTDEQTEPGADNL